MIKAIFFDWGNTFCRSFPDVQEKKVEVLLKPFGFNWKSFYPYWRSLYYLRSLGRIKSDDEMEVWCKRILQREDFPMKEILTLNIDSYYLPAENIKVVNELKRSYKVGVIANGVKEWIEQVIKKYKIETLFDGLFVSSEIGVRKPDARIFYIALKEFSVKPKETVFVSDELGDDLVGAKGCGMKIIWLYQGIEKEILEIVQPDGIIKNLKEAIPIINKISKL